MLAGPGPGLLALALALWPAGLWAQLRLQEAGGGLRAPGDSVTLSCRGSGFTFKDYEILWYRQSPGGRLEWVSFISSPRGTTEDYGAAVKGRAKTSRDNSRSEAFLSLRPLQGLWAQLRLQEAGGGLRAPGDSITLSCRGSGFTFKDYGIFWYRQSPGGRLEWVSVISYDTRIFYFDQSVQGRAKISRDNSRSEVYLSLLTLQPQDSARYFCAVHTATGNPAGL